MRRGKRNLLIWLAPVTALCAVLGGYAYWHLAGGGLPPEAPTAAQDELDPGTGPLFRFGNLYLDGRSEWFRGRFDSEVKKASSSPAQAPLAGSATAGAEPRATVHREPFTRGPWVATLPPELAAYRLEVESNTMESAFDLSVEGVGALHLLLFLVFADFRKDLAGIGELTRQVHLPPLPAELAGLPVPPRLGPGLFLCHEERKHPQPLARPTSLYHIYRMSRERDGLLLRFELWKNTGGDAHAAVHLDSGQYLIRESDGRATASFLSFYSGQKIPPLFGGMAEGMTADFYREFVRGVLENAPRWKAPPEALRWAEEALKGTSTGYSGKEP